MSITINPISPVAFSVLGLDIRWYALAYIAAFVVGYWLVRRLTSSRTRVVSLTKQELDDLLTAIIIGVMISINPDIWASQPRTYWKW